MPRRPPHLLPTQAVQYTSSQASKAIANRGDTEHAVPDAGIKVTQGITQRIPFVGWSLLGRPLLDVALRLLEGAGGSAVRPGGGIAIEDVIVIEPELLAERLRALAER